MSYPSFFSGCSERCLDPGFRLTHLMNAPSRFAGEIAMYSNNSPSFRVAGNPGVIICSGGAAALNRSHKWFHRLRLKGESLGRENQTPQEWVTTRPRSLGLPRADDLGIGSVPDV